MRRSEVEQRVKSFPAAIRAKIESEPLPSVVVAFVLGVLLAALPGLIATVLLLAVVGGALFWFLADKDEHVFTAEPDEKEKPATAKTEQDTSTSGSGEADLSGAHVNGTNGASKSPQGGIAE